MKKIIEFRVTGARQFPLDMLRYDHCWPATADDVVTVSEILSGDIPAGHQTQVLMRGLGVTVGRWASFGWIVSDIRKV